MSDKPSKNTENSRPEGTMPPISMTCMPGQIVFEQGAPAHQAFFVEDGLVEVIIEEGGHTVKLAEIGPGEVFGEMGVLERESRLATVRAIEKTKISVMTKDELELRIENVGDPIVSAVINGLTRRLRLASLGQVQYYKNLAEFQDRVAGIMKKANEGIDPARRKSFAAEIEPLLDQVEDVLDKYRK